MPRQGEGVISTSFWWLRCTEQSRSSKAKTLPCMSAATCISMWRTEVSSFSTNRRGLPKEACAMAEALEKADSSWASE